MNPSLPPPESEVAALAEPSPSHYQQLQRFAELGRLSASLLHEISNPLTAALLQLEDFDLAHAGVRQAKRSLRLLHRYVEAARQQINHSNTSTSARFAVKSHLEQIKRIMVPQAKAAGVQLRIEAVPDCKLYGDPVKFQHILANLISNAIDSYHSSSPSAIRPVSVRFTTSGRWLTIQVIDWGEGITAEQIPLLFVPFYTTKGQTGHGLGIGLFMVHHYVTQDFHGSIKVTSSRRGGTQFSLKLPLT